MTKVPIETPDSRLITICTVKDAVKAEIIKNELESHNIRCQLGGEHQAGLTGTLGVEIIVLETDAVRAKAILKEDNLA